MQSSTKVTEIKFPLQRADGCQRFYVQKSRIGQKEVLASPTAGNSVFQNSAFSVHSASLIFSKSSSNKNGRNML